MSSYPGLFVALEGIDGSGKTTQMDLVKATLEQHYPKVYVTSEPSSGRLGPVLREYLSDPKSHPAVDALVFAADRVEHYFSEILPKLEDGYIVITDRYKASSIVYQGLSNLSNSWIETINNQVPDPDITIYLTITVDQAIVRLGEADRTHLEKFETTEKLQTLLTRYEQLNMTGWLEVDGTQSVEDITSDIAKLILDRIE